MIEWNKSADLNKCSVDELKARFERFPKSNKRIIAICDNPDCNKEREMSRCDYRDLCRSCSTKKSHDEDPTIGQKQGVTLKKRYHDDSTLSKKTSIAGKKRFEDPGEREKSSIAGKKAHKDNPDIGINNGLRMKKLYKTNPEKWHTIKHKEACEKFIGGQDIVGHHMIYDHSDLTKNIMPMTRSMHTTLHNLFKKYGIEIPHINI